MVSLFSVYLFIAMNIIYMTQGYPKPQRYYTDVDLLYKDEPSAYYDAYILPDEGLQNYIRKRGINKRFSINDLLKKLQAIYGRDDIYHNGRSTYVRFGPGGKR